MLNISYTISPRLNNYLLKIENLRKVILLTPLTQKAKLKLRWEATLDRTSASLELCGNPLKRAEIAKLFTHNKAKLRKDELEVVNYKKAIDYILQSWLGSPQPVDSETIIALSKIIGESRLSAPKEELNYLFDYLSARQENPVIQAAIVNVELMKMQPFTHNNRIISLLASILFLYKYGYDFRGFLAYEAQWAEDKNYFYEHYTLAMNAPTLTLWLEYFALCMTQQLEKVQERILRPSQNLKDFSKALWELNDRQKLILASLDRPDATITNRKIQKEYKTPQITASRDLAKLTNLGLLFSHGKGRSVYYTKI